MDWNTEEKRDKKFERTLGQSTGWVVPEGMQISKWLSSKCSTKGTATTAMDIAKYTQIHKSRPSPSKEGKKEKNNLSLCQTSIDLYNVPKEDKSTNTQRENHYIFLTAFTHHNDKEHMMNIWNVNLAQLSFLS